MRMKLLKGVLREGKMALGLSAGLVVGRIVVNQLANRVEKEAKAQEKSGQLTPALRKKLQVYRIARGILHVL